jgi:hypothetical protein
MNVTEEIKEKCSHTRTRIKRENNSKNIFFERGESSSQIQTQRPKKKRTITTKIKQAETVHKCFTWLSQEGPQIFWILSLGCSSDNNNNGCQLQ